MSVPRYVTRCEFPCAHVRKRTEYPRGDRPDAYTEQGAMVLVARTVCTKCGVTTHTEYEKVNT